MKIDSVVEINKPETSIDDPLTEILRQRARSLLAQELEVEIETVLCAIHFYWTVNPILTGQ